MYPASIKKSFLNSEPASLTETCEYCIFFHQTSAVRWGTCDLMPRTKVRYENRCDDFESVLIIVNDINRIREEDPLLDIDLISQKISQAHDGKYSPDLVKHLMRSSSSHELAYRAWQQYKRNSKKIKRKEIEENKRKRRRKTKEYVNHLVDLGLMSDPDKELSKKQRKSSAQVRWLSFANL